MKVVISKTGWESFKMTQAEWKRYVVETVRAELFAVSEATANSAAHEDDGDLRFKKPRRARLTVIYEIADETGFFK